ncbi:MAG: hypothetical protein KDD69_13620 [Bdellovibrionales bacterium]|nr:hypothetical protein [Bdellovibrionales bacterium]
MKVSLSDGASNQQTLGYWPKKTDETSSKPFKKPNFSAPDANEELSPSSGVGHLTPNQAYISKISRSERPKNGDDHVILVTQIWLQKNSRTTETV